MLEVDTAVNCLACQINNHLLKSDDIKSLCNASTSREISVTYILKWVKM